MGFKYTYNGTEHTVSEDTKTLTTRGKYLEDNILIQAEGGLKEISTEAAMDALLVEANNGKYYKYTGTTTTKYHQGSIYKMVYVSGITYENQGSYGFEIDNTILSLDHEVYDDIYKSNNYNKNSSNAVTKVSWQGTEPVEVWINSYAESSYDYTIASKLNASSIPTVSSNGNTQIHTSSFQKNPRSGLNETYWKKYTYTGGSGTNFIYIVFRKDGSVSNADDRGYFVIKKINSCKFKEFPIIDTDTINITTTNTVDVTHSKNAKVQSANLTPSNIKSGVNILGVVGNYTPTPNLQNKTIIANGNYTADSGYDGLGTVTVNVSGGSGYNIESLDNGDGTQTLSINYVEPEPSYKLTITVEGSGNNDADYENVVILINGVDEIRPFSEPGGKISYPVTIPISNVKTFKVSGFSNSYWNDPSFHRINESDFVQGSTIELREDSTLTLRFLTCLTGDTLVLMANRTQKRIDEIELGEEILSYDWETMKLVPNKVIYTDKDLKKSHIEYDEWVFDDGTIIKTVHRHEFFNVESQCMRYMDEWNIGEHAYKIDGTTPMLIEHRVITETVNHYKITGEKGTNFFANGLLNGDRNNPKNIKLGGND